MWLTQDCSPTKAIYNSTKVCKSRGYKAMLPSPGAYNTFTSVDKEMHARKRKVMSQGLTDQCIRRFEPTLLAHVDVFIKRLYRGAVGAWPAQALNMTECCRHLSYDVMGAFGFGQPFRMQTSDDNHFLLHAVKTLMHKVSVYVQHPALQTLRLEALFSRRSSRMRARYARLMADLVQRRLAAGRDAQHDLFAFLAHAGEFSADELWAESRFLLIAGTFAAPLLAHCFADAHRTRRGHGVHGAGVVVLLPSSAPGLLPEAGRRGPLDVRVRSRDPVGRAAGVVRVPAGVHGRGDAHVAADCDDAVARGVRRRRPRR